MCGVLPMNDLLAAQALLTKAMAVDIRLALANAVAWLDPAHIMTHQNDVGDDDLDEDEITQALRLCRQLFPEVYAGAMQYLWQGTDTPRLESVLIDGINTHLVMKLTSLEELVGGIPVETLGVSFYEADFFENNPHLADVVTDLGVKADC